ncbi:hypothetical protein VB264_23310 [Arcicella aquatica]|uniref:Uncharacterized protein n=1 Tax=Arcicella aquatica TaxID=217141 RepID=A0ABU5QUG6_9BACT|nr:hypothetical protein [Arcicella aquatica]MEA5260747.1 hypothetical protein [Arcicella aquatica]
MNNNEFVNRVVTLKMRNGVYFKGILLGLGSKWALLKYIPVDFVTDGYVLINTNYISTFDMADDDIFTEKVIKLKQINVDLKYKFDLESPNQVLDILKENAVLIGIELKNHQKMYVGIIKIVREKSMKVHLISKACEWLKEETFLYNELRAIYFEGDYLYSLNLYIQSLQ